MKFKLITHHASIACLLAGVYVSEAAAQTDYNGSDTLQQVTDYLVANFPTECGNINYLGEGSSAGEEDMCEDKQKSAPMSRVLNRSKVCPGEDDFDCPAVTNGSSVQSMVIGKDNLAIARRQSTQSSCTNLVEQSTWEETLRTIYGGKDGQGQANANSCQHADRVNFANNWDALFSDCGSGDESCTGLNHALRRDDNSGTTGVFMDLIDIDAFCNGSADGFENQDNDPIRVSCDSFTSTERYCPLGGTNGGTLGLVLPISVPSGSGKSAAWITATQNNNACQPGSFEYRLHFNPEDPSSFTECPYGGPKVGGQQCLFPKDANGDFGCNNLRFNRPAAAPLSWDGRVFNQQHRLASGAPVVDKINEFHRLSVGCNESSSTDQIGCIVGSQSCYIGFGGVEMLNAADTTSVNLAGQSPTGSGSYPFSRNLYFNTLQGFSAATNQDEIDMISCYMDQTKMDAALIANGFFSAGSEFGELENTCQ